MAAIAQFTLLIFGVKSSGGDGGGGGGGGGGVFLTATWNAGSASFDVGGLQRGFR